MQTYASDADLTAWGINPVPDNSATLIRYASALVLRATARDMYATDGDGYPTDSKRRSAMRDAVCAQVETWVAADIDPVVGATQPGRIVTAKSIGGASLSYAGAAEAAVARARVATSLCDHALDVLRAAGLCSPRVRRWGR